MTGIGRSSFNPNVASAPTQDAHEAASSSAGPSSNVPGAPPSQELPEYRRRLMERVSPQLQEYIRNHGGQRVDKKEFDPPARATKIENPEHSYFLQMNAARSWDPAEGKQVLGEGKEGKVRHILRQDGVEFAVKKFSRREGMHPAQVVISSEREYAAYRQLGLGKHFIRAHDLIHTEKRTVVDGEIKTELKSYMVLDLLKGKNLKKTAASLLEGVQSGEIPGEVARTEVRELVRQSLESLRDFHESGLWHGDVGPWNLFREESGNVDIIDLTASQEPQGDIQAALQWDIKGLCSVLGELAPALLAVGSEEAKRDEEYLQDIAKHLKSGECSLDDLLDEHPYFAP